MNWNIAPIEAPCQSNSLHIQYFVGHVWYVCSHLILVKQ